MTEEEQVRFGKLVDLLHDRHIDEMQMRDELEHYKYQLGKCDEFISHQTHEVAVAKGKRTPMSRRTRKDKIRAILSWGMDEKSFCERAVEGIDGFIEQYYVRTEHENDS